MKRHLVGRIARLPRAAKGLVEPVPDEVDRRSIRVRLSEWGWALVDTTLE